jgi:hypothetical protein
MGPVALRPRFATGLPFSLPGPGPWLEEVLPRSALFQTPLRKELLDADTHTGPDWSITVKGPPIHRGNSSADWLGRPSGRALADETVDGLPDQEIDGGLGVMDRWTFLLQ